MDRHEDERRAERPRDHGEHHRGAENEDAHDGIHDGGNGNGNDDGPPSLHVEGLPSASHEMQLLGARAQEQHELSYLRLENALQKKKVTALEKLSRGEKRGAKLLVDESEMERVNELLQKAAAAKAEAVDYVANTSRDKLGQDVKALQSILRKAKAERHAFKHKIRAAEEKLARARQQIEKEEIRFQVDRELFAKILQDDRAAHKLEVQLLVEKLADALREKHALAVWAQEQHARHLHEIRKLARALGRATKLVQENAAAGERVLRDVQRVRATAVAAPERAPPSPPTAGDGEDAGLESTAAAT